MLKALRKMVKGQEGFTLIELMVVVIIIGILAAVAIPQFSGQAEKARQKAAIADLRTVSTNVQLYYTENDSTWPLYLSEIQGYMGGDDYLTDPWGEGYYYDAPDDGDDLQKTDLYSYGSPNGNLYWIEND